MMKKWMIFALITLCGVGAYGQAIVKGKVSEASGETLPFVNILIKNTSQGTTTDIDGNFSIQVDPTDTLIFSFMGFLSQEIAVGNQSIINVVLQENLAQLEEVVVVGYGVTKKQDITGSVAVLDTEELRQFPVSNIGSAMQGRLSGVQVVNASEPGTNPQILIRGMGTIFGDPNPLVVIDGLQTGVGALANLDPTSIESLQVLKDASAAAIYGSRAANGVIIITTKRGTKDQFQVNFSSEIGMQTVASRFDLMNTEEYARYTADLYVNASSGLVVRNPPAWTSNPEVLANDTDWQSEIFQNALLQNHNVNFSGGGNNSTYYLGLGYLKQEGVVERSSFERFNLQINSQTKQNKFTFGESLNLFFRDKPQTELTSNPQLLYNAAPQMPMFDEDNLNGLGAPFPAITGGNNIANPLAYRFRTVENRGYGVLGNLFAEFELTDWLSIRSDLNLDFSYSDFERFRVPLEQSQAAISRNDTEIQLRSILSSRINSETLLKFNKSFDAHEISGVIGYTSILTVNKGLTANGNNLEPGTRVPQTGQNILATGINNEDRLLSQLARVNYFYNSRYLLTASIRRDGSSNFGRNNRWGIFPSFSLGWQLGDEPFMDGVAWLSGLKIRGGYGELGRTLGSFLATLNSQVRYPWETGMVTGVSPLTVPNENLKWETVKQVNVGFDAAFFKNMLKLTVDVFSRRSDDMIIRSPLPQYTGVVDQPWINFGSMINSGVETELTFNHYVNENFSQQFRANITFNRNEVLALNGQQDTLLANGTLTTVGQPVAVHYGWLTAGINPQTGAMNFQDLDGDNVITGNDRVILGSPHPDAFFGLNYSASFKSFDFSLFIQGVIGNQIMNQSLQDLGSTHSDRNRLRAVLDNAYDEETNPNGTWPIISLRDENNNDRIAERYIENGDYLRVRNVQLGYTMPATLANGFFQKLRVYASVVNLLTITGYSGLDPDLNNNGDVFSLGRDTFRYPPVRSFNFGVQATF